jgi:hypothetical protein
MNDTPLALAAMLVALGLWTCCPPDHKSGLLLTGDVLRDVALTWLAILALVGGTVWALSVLPPS